MEAEPTDAREMRDHELNEALEAHAAEELDGLSIQNQRLARVQEYEEAALARSDPFAAVIGMGNAYLQRVFEHLGAAILDELDSRRTHGRRAPRVRTGNSPAGQIAKFN